MKKWPVLLLALGTFCVGTFIGFLARAVQVSRNERKRSESTRYVSRLLRNFYYPPETGYAALYARFMSTLPNVLESNTTNIGAEVLYRMFGQSYWSSDTDADGLREVADALGDPVVFLTTEFPEDSVVDGLGYARSVARPPYCHGKFYLAVLSCHPWLPEDARAMDAWEELLSQLEPVADIASSDAETRTLVQEELSRAEIDCWIEGSVIYVVSVKASEAEAARRVIRDSKRLRGKRVDVINAGDQRGP